MSAGIWFAALIALSLLEFATAGLVSIWFCFGALAALIISLCQLPVAVQVSVFFFVSILLLIFTRPILKKYLMKPVRTNFDIVIGKTAIVIEDIDNLKPSGQVKVKGQVWTARNVIEDAVILKGESVQVLSIEGVKLIVGCVEENTDTLNEKLPIISSEDLNKNSDPDENLNSEIG